MGVTWMGSMLAPTTTILPFVPRPSNSAVMALPLGAVAKITRAPPNFFNSSAGLEAWLSM